MITSVAGDDEVNGAEAGAAEVPVSGKVSGEFNAGDVVTIVVNGTRYTNCAVADGNFNGTGESAATWLPTATK